MMYRFYILPIQYQTGLITFQFNYFMRESLPLSLKNMNVQLYMLYIAVHAY